MAWEDSYFNKPNDAHKSEMPREASQITETRSSGLLECSKRLPLKEDVLGPENDLEYSCVTFTGKLPQARRRAYCLDRSCRVTES